MTFLRSLTVDDGLIGTLNVILCEGRMTVINGCELVGEVEEVVVAGVWVSRECGRRPELPVGGGEGGEAGESVIYPLEVV